MGQLDAHGGGQAIAHGPQAAGGHPAIGLFKPVILRGPHLVLANLGGDVGIPVLGQGIEPLDGILRFDLIVRGAIGQAVARAPCVDLGPPAGLGLGIGLVTLGFPQGDHVAHDRADIPDNANIDADRLIDRRGVNIDMDLF